MRFVRHHENLPYNPFARHILWNLQDVIKNASVNRTSISRLSQIGKDAERPKAERIKVLAYDNGDNGAIHKAACQRLLKPVSMERNNMVQKTADVLRSALIDFI